MNKVFAQQILQDIQTVSLQRMQSVAVHLVPFSRAYMPISFSEEYFHQLPLSSSSMPAYFIDGGNAEILQTPDYCLQFLRFACVGFQKGKRIFQKKKEGYVLAASVQQDKKMIITMKGYGALRDVLFPSLTMDDPLLAELPLRTRLSKAIEIFRALYEVQFARYVLDFLPSSLLVFDRALLPENSYEQEAFRTLADRAMEKNIVVLGVNKTTALLCNTGESVVSQLASFGKQGSWLYYPVFSSYDVKHNVVLAFVRLHPRSQYIFRLEVCAGFVESILDVGSLLASQSTDGTFLGYPYGLIVADQLARISNKERAALRTLFFTHTGKEQFAVAALNAHDILDGAKSL